MGLVKTKNRTLNILRHPVARTLRPLVFNQMGIGMNGRVRGGSIGSDEWNDHSMAAGQNSEFFRREEENIKTL